MGLKEIERTINKYNGNQKVEIIDFLKKTISDSIENIPFVNKKLIQLICFSFKYFSNSERELISEKVINTKILQIRTFILNNSKLDLFGEKQHFCNFSEWILTTILEINNTFYFNDSEYDNGNNKDRNKSDINKKGVSNKDRDKSDKDRNKSDKDGDINNKDRNKSKIDKKDHIDTNISNNNDKKNIIDNKDDKSHISRNDNSTINISRNDKFLDSLIQNFHKKLCDEFKLIFCSNEKFNSAGNQLVLDIKKYFDSFEGFEQEKKSLMEKIVKNFNSNKILSNDKLDEIYNKIK